MTRRLCNILAGINADDVENLQSAENIDPEVRPGLFQGDMALNNEVRANF